MKKKPIEIGKQGLVSKVLRPVYQWFRELTGKRIFIITVALFSATILIDLIFQDFTQQLDLTANLVVESMGLIIGLIIVRLWLEKSEREAEAKQKALQLASEQRIRNASLAELRLWRNFGWTLAINTARIIDDDFSKTLHSPPYGFSEDIRKHWSDLIRILEDPAGSLSTKPALRGTKNIRLSEITNIVLWPTHNLNDAIERSLRLYLSTLQAYPEIIKSADGFTSIFKMYLEQANEARRQAEENSRRLHDASRRGRLSPEIGPIDIWVLEPIATEGLLANFRQVGRSALQVVYLCEKEIGEWQPPTEVSRYGGTWGGNPILIYFPDGYWPDRIYPK